MSFQESSIESNSTNLTEDEVTIMDFVEEIRLETLMEIDQNFAENELDFLDHIDDKVEDILTLLEP